MTIKDRVIKVVSMTLQVPASSINEASSPDNIEQWDSMQHMNLILGLEEEFSVQFTDQQVIDLLNVELIVMTLVELGVSD